MNLKKSVLGLACLACSSLALAVPTTGGISFSSIDSSAFNWDPSLDFLNFTDNNGQVDDVSGEFALYANDGETASFSDFYYGTNFSTGLLWETANLTFHVESLTSVFEGASFVGLEGTGYVSDGTATNPGLWNATANTAGGTFSWSSSTEATDASVPEPASLVLLGLAAAGLAGRRLRAKA